MKLKYRLKKYADNEFTAITGILAIQMRGGSNCLICNIIKTKDVPIQKYAYFQYNKLYKPYPPIKLSTTCNVSNCVNKDHLIATYHPTKENIQYINTYLHVDGIEQLAFNLKIPVTLLSAYLKLSPPL
jgi:hypothetical protein